MSKSSVLSTGSAARARIRAHFLEGAAVRERTSEECASNIEKAAELISDALRRKDKLLICGNGGSAADSQHIAAEFVSVLSQTFLRPGLGAIALTTDSSFLTASANDFGFSGVFRRQVEALGRRGDVLMGISTSGSSENVVEAMRVTQKLGIGAIALTGREGGAIGKLANVTVQVPSDNVQLIQESHIAIGHIICELVEHSLFD